jgi:hypothetical protein
VHYDLMGSTRSRRKRGLVIDEDQRERDLIYTHEAALSSNITNGSRRASSSLIVPLPVLSCVSFLGGIGSLAIGGPSMTLMTVNVQFAGDRSGPCPDPRLGHISCE